MTVKQLHDSRDQQLKAIFTAEQYQKFEKNRDLKKAERQQNKPTLAGKRSLGVAPESKKIEKQEQQQRGKGKERLKKEVDDNDDN